jgi:hypothetical protein
LGRDFHRDLPLLNRFSQQSVKPKGRSDKTEIGALVVDRAQKMPRDKNSQTVRSAQAIAGREPY